MKLHFSNELLATCHNMRGILRQAVNASLKVSVNVISLISNSSFHDGCYIILFYYHSILFCMDSALCVFLYFLVLYHKLWQHLFFFFHFGLQKWEQ